VGAFSAEFVARRLALSGAFEAHLTVETDRGEAFAALCGELGVDHVAIELASGEHHAQPMTASHHRGRLADVMGEIDALYARIEAAGFPIVRTKVEAAPDIEGLPTPEGYFEFHVKVRNPPLELAAIAEAHGGRLSRNERSAGQRFVTLRSYSDRATAEARLATLLEALASVEIAGVVREYTVYDSRIQLDAGWLEPP
jgi:hypothetical protein